MSDVNEPGEDTALPTLRPGAVAIMDALGFKGIWNASRPDRVVQALTEAREAAKRSVRFHKYFGRGNMHVATFSDTIVVTVQEAESPGRALRGLTRAAASVAAAAGPVPLAFRGCIATGQLLVANDVFIGGAMDEAAALYEQANASLTWFTPSAVTAFGEMHEQDIDVMPWTVPLKGGGALDTIVVNPFRVLLRNSPELEWARLDELEERLLARLRQSHHVDVVLKLQNTARFLAAAKAYTIQRYPAHLAMMVEALSGAMEKSDA